MLDTSTTSIQTNDAHSGLPRTLTSSSSTPSQNGRRRLRLASSPIPPAQLAAAKQGIRTTTRRKAPQTDEGAVPPDRFRQRTAAKEQIFEHLKNQLCQRVSKEVPVGEVLSKARLLAIAVALASASTMTLRERGRKHHTPSAPEVIAERYAALYKERELSPRFSEPSPSHQQHMDFLHEEDLQPVSKLKLFNDGSMSPRIPIVHSNKENVEDDGLMSPRRLMDQASAFSSMCSAGAGWGSALVHALQGHKMTEYVCMRN